MGVPIFFVISAFLLYRPYVASRIAGSPSIGTAGFFARRALRIIPAYWLALLGVLVYLGFTASAIQDALLAMFFLQAYRPETIFVLIPGAWSLCVEVAFYLVLPLYAVIVRPWANGPEGLRRELLLLAAIAVASVVFRGAVEITAGRSVWGGATVPGTAMWFAVGMAAAVVSVGSESGDLRGRLVEWITERSAAMWWSLALLLFVAVNIPFTAEPPFDPVDPPQANVPADLARYVLYGLIAGCVLAPAVFATSQRSWIRRLLALPSLAWLGVISYGIFLWHDLMFDVFADGADLDPRGIALAGMATVGCAAFSYYLVERPLLRHKPGVGKRARQDSNL